MIHKPSDICSKIPQTPYLRILKVKVYGDMEVTFQPIKTSAQWSETRVLHVLPRRDIVTVLFREPF